MADDDEPGAVTDAAELPENSGAESDSAAADSTAAESAKEATAGTAPRWWGRGMRIAAATAAVLLVVALVAVNVLLAHKHDAARSVADQRAEYIRAAQQEVLNVLTVHYDSADRDVQRILDDATGPWRVEFAPQAQSFTDAVRKAKVVTTAEIAGAGLERVNDDGTAQVLLTAHSKVSNSAGAHEEPRTFRVRVTLARDDGRLEISKMEYVTS